MPEFYSRTGRKTYTSAKEHQRWNDLPYGRWTCADGRVVLFNRYYEPIWQRPGAGGEWLEADPAEWVSFERQEWFYDDGHKEPAKRSRAEASLIDAGIPLPQLDRRRATAA